MEMIPLLRRYAFDSQVGVIFGVFDAKHASEVSAFAHFEEDFVGDLLCFVPVGYVGHKLVFDPLADFVTEGNVGLVVVGGVVLELCVSWGCISVHRPYA